MLKEKCGSTSCKTSSKDEGDLLPEHQNDAEEVEKVAESTG